MSDAYSPLKALRHLDVVQAVREGRPARPVHVQVILSDACDQSCRFCSYRSPTYTSSQLFYTIEPPGSKRGLRRDAEHPERNFNPNRMIPHEKVIEILDDCAEMGVEAIQFTGGGEPTVHPDFREIAEGASVRGLAWSLVTNGVNAYRKGYWNVLHHAAWVRFSLDCSNATTYAAVRMVPPERFEDACNAVRRTRADVDGMHASTVIGVGFVVTPDNWREVYDATRLAKELGAHNIRISAEFTVEDERRFLGFHAECAALCARAEADFGGAEFTVFNRFSARLDDLRLRSPDYQICGYAQFTTYIGGDLNVYRCCATAYNEQGLLGSLKDQRFRDLWLSQERADNMRQFDARSCARCMFNSQNRVLDYALRAEQPEHAEFV